MFKNIIILVNLIITIMVLLKIKKANADINMISNDFYTSDRYYKSSIKRLEKRVYKNDNNNR